MKTKSKLLILLLTLALLCGAFVFMTSAETTTTTVSSSEDLATAWGAAADGDTISIGADFTYSGSTLNLEAGKTLTLDLDGHTLTVGDTAFLTSAGNLTVKNGTIVMGNAIAIQTTGGELTLTDLTVKNEIADTVASPIASDKSPSTIVGVSATTAKLTNVTISGVAKRALKIAANSTVTAENATIRNAKLPGNGSNGSDNGNLSFCAAIEINGDNTVEMRKSVVEAIYDGFLFTANGNALDEETKAPKNTVLFEDSVLNVTFKENITGDNLASITGNPYNSGNLYKICVKSTAHVSFTFDRSKVTGYNGAKGIGCEDGTTTNTKACFTVRDSQLFMQNWGCKIYMTFEGTNFLLSNATPTFGGRTLGLRAAAGSRTYFIGEFNLEGVSGTYTFVKGDNNEYDTANLALTQLPTSFRFWTKCGYNATSSTMYTMTYVLTPKDEAPDMTTTEFANEKYDGRRTVMIYNADGTVHSVCYEGILAWDIPEGGTLRFYDDAIISPLSGSVASFTRNVSIDMNGHWLSIGGAPTGDKHTPFLVSAAVDVYFYTSRKGGGIRLLSATGGAESYQNSTTSSTKGSNPMIEIKSGNDAHVHLGYAEADGEVLYQDNDFTMLSSVIVQVYGGKVTVKGGNYYRVFNDNAGFFNVRYTTPENTEILSFENAYFYAAGTYSVVTTQGSTTTQKNMNITFKNCTIDNAAIFSPTGAGYATTCEGVKITLTDCNLALSSATDYTNIGVTVEIGDGCRYMTGIALPDSFFGDVTRDVNTDAYELVRREVTRLTPAQLAAGGTTYTGATTTRTLTKKATENYANVIGIDGTTSKWEIGATVSASGSSYREDNIVHIAIGIVLKNGDEVYAGGKIPDTLPAKTDLTVKIEYEDKTIAVAFIAEDGTETYLYPAANDAEDGIAFMRAMKALNASTQVILYKNLTLDENCTVSFSSMSGKTVKLDFNGYRLTTTNKVFPGANTSKTVILFTTNGATVNIYSSRPGGGVKGPGANQVLVSTNGGGNTTIGKYGEYPGSNFSISDMVVCTLWSNGVTVDGGTYSRTGGSNGTLFFLETVNAPVIKNATILLNLDKAWNGYGIFLASSATCKVTIENCDFYTNDTNAALFTTTSSANVTSLTATINGGNFYGLTLAASVNRVAPLTYNISNSPKFMAVAEGAVAGKTLVRINDAYLEGKTNSPVSCLLADSEEGSYSVTFKYDGGEVNERWLAGSKPTYRANVFGSNEESTYYWYAAATAGITADSEYTAKLKTTESKITGNLTLYANITFNLYFRADGFIKGVKYKGETTTFSNTVKLKGEDYYLFKIDDISPKDLSDAFTLEVILEGTTATYTVNTSLSKYAASVLASTESAEGKNLVMALLDYVYEMSIEPKLGGKDPTSSEEKGLQAVKKGLDYYKQILKYEREEWDKTAPDLKPGNITDASLKLASTPGFIFYLSTTASEDGTIKDYTNSERVSVTINGVTKSYKVTTAEGSKPYIIVDDIHVSKYNDIMTVELDSVSFEYSLGAYMKGYGDNIPEYAKALYNYVCAAKAYLEAQGN